MTALIALSSACAGNKPAPESKGPAAGRHQAADNKNSEEITNEKIYDVPVIMYHSVKPNKTGKYSIAPEEFEDDLIFLRKQGFTTVTVSELIRFKEGSFEMPEKPVILTFDDGWYNNYTRVFPLLKKYGAKASFFVIGAFVKKFSDGRPQYEATSYLSFEDIAEMAGSGLCDIQNHSYGLHDWTKGRNGAGRKKDESLEDYKTALVSDINKNQQMLSRECGVTPRAFAYPFGVYNADTQKILADMGFSAIITTDEGINKISLSGGDSLLHLKRINRPHGTDTAVFFKESFPGLF